MATKHLSAIFLLIVFSEATPALAVDIGDWSEFEPFLEWREIGMESTAMQVAGDDDVWIAMYHPESCGSGIGHWKEGEYTGFSLESDSADEANLWTGRVVDVHVAGNHGWAIGWLDNEFCEPQYPVLWMYDGIKWFEPEFGTNLAQQRLYYAPVRDSTDPEDERYLPIHPTSETISTLPDGSVWFSGGVVFSDGVYSEFPRPPGEIFSMKMSQRDHGFAVVGFNREAEFTVDSADVPDGAGDFLWLAEYANGEWTLLHALADQTVSWPFHSTIALQRESGASGRVAVWFTTLRVALQRMISGGNPVVFDNRNSAQDIRVLGSEDLNDLFYTYGQEVLQVSRNFDQNPTVQVHRVPSAQVSQIGFSENAVWIRGQSVYIAPKIAAESRVAVRAKSGATTFQAGSQIRARVNSRLTLSAIEFSRADSSDSVSIDAMEVIFPPEIGTSVSDNQVRIGQEAGILATITVVVKGVDYNFDVQTVPGAITTLVIDPSDINIAEGERVDFGARGIDRFGNEFAITGANVGWHVVPKESGQIDARTGVFSPENAFIGEAYVIAVVSRSLRFGDTSTSSSTGTGKVTVGMSSVPSQYDLAQNHPNPFNPSTTIELTVPHDVDGKLTIFNSVGQIVSELYEGELPRGSHSFLYRATDLSSGPLFYRFQSNDFTETRVMTLLR